MLGVAVALSAGAAVAGPQYEWLRLDRLHVKWGAPTAGVGTVVTYAFAARSTRVADARNCRDMRPLDGLAAQSRVAPAELESETEAAFAMWQAVADIRFRRAEDPARADILIGAQAKPIGVAFADVAYGDAAGDGIRSIRRSLICLNPEKRWTAGFDDDPDTYDLRYALAHEIGHAIGLDHPGPSGQLMSFRYEERFRELQPGDVAGAVGLYGASPGTIAADDVPATPAPAAAEAAAAACMDGATTAGTTALTPRDDRC